MKWLKRAEPMRAGDAESPRVREDRLPRDSGPSSSVESPCERQHAEPSAEPGPHGRPERVKPILRRAWRLPAMVALLFGGLITVIVVFPMIGPPRRDRTVATWSRWLMRSSGIRIREPGGESEGMAKDAAEPVADAQADVAADSPAGTSSAGMSTEIPSAGLLVANHVSWVDIFVINALAPSSFIAKDDIARWPLIGTLVGRVGTLFLERGKRHAVHRALTVVAEQLRAGRRVAVFPEGTTGTGDVLQPFHANLIEAAVKAEAPLLPVGLRYRGLNGERLSGEGGVIDFVGSRIGFLGSVWRITGASGVVAEIHRLPPIVAPDDSGNRARHLLAAQARQAISERLAIPMDDTTPETVKGLRER
ncbi:MAG: lysophospholipid acyltransferase family protein [Burkholderiaceae bacterium]